jgi:hypothetical protein
MKRFISTIIIAVGLSASSAFATTYTYSTTAFDSMPSDTDGIHGNHYVWGIAGTVLPVGQVITSATLTITALNNYERSSADTIYTNLLNTATVGTSSSNGIEDTFSGVSDYFQKSTSNSLYNGQTELAATVSNPATGTQYYPNASTLTINFTTSEIQALTADLADGNFGFGFDDHCHWYDNGITFTYTTAPAPVPEPGTLMLLGIGMAGLSIFGKRRMRKEV